MPLAIASRAFVPDLGQSPSSSSKANQSEKKRAGRRSSQCGDFRLPQWIDPDLLGVSRAMPEAAKARKRPAVTNSYSYPRSMSIKGRGCRSFM